MVAVAEARLQVAVVVGRDHAAAEALARSLPTASGMSVVFAMSDPRHLMKRLRDASAVPVVDVRKSLSLEPDHIYVLPKDRETSITKRWLALDAPNGHVGRDRLLRSLADSYGADCAAIILGGPGSDGVLGAKRVKEAGGLTICQLAGADQSELPRTASATGIIDLALPANEIGPRLVALAESAREDVVASTDTADPLAGILELLQTRTGHDFAVYKRAVLQQRLLRRMRIRQTATVVEYERFLRKTPGELAHLFRDFLISVTDFFRDAGTFEALAARVIPTLFEGKGRNDEVRVWVPGCATGEEAYSIAIMLWEYAARLASPPRLQLFATDIDEEALRDARAGIYPEAIATDVTPHRLQQFFTHEVDHYRVNDELRDIISFAAHSLLRDAPFSRLDLISCRGVLSYLDDAATQRALATFHHALRRDGHLLLGADEHASASHFLAIDPEHHIYRREAGDALVPSAPPSGSSAAPGRDLHEHVLATHAPPGVLLDDKLDIVYLSERAQPYFGAADRAVTRNALKLVHPALRPALSRATYAAGELRRSSVARTVVFEEDRRLRTIELRVRAVAMPDVDNRLLLLTIEELDRNHDVGSNEQRVSTRASTTEDYEAALDELRASNEELYVMNEELRSATDEIERGRSELHAVNDELSGLNHQLSARLDELGRRSNDLQEMLSIADVGVVFLDEDLKIRHFTPSMKQLFNVIESDIGRPLSDLTHQLDCDDLVASAQQVVATLYPIERAVRARSGRRYLVRMTPHRSREDRIDGVVCRFVDITERLHAEEGRRRAEDELSAAELRLELALRTTGAVLISHDAELRVSCAYLRGKRVDDIALFLADRNDYAALTRRVFATGITTVADVAITLDGTVQSYRFRIEPMFDQSHVIGVTSIGVGH
ncbi:MAG TPA: CheR family methyltransferase [Kofleriaceae bacterium]